MDDSIQVDRNNQPLNRIFNSKRNREKSLYSLAGMLQGLVIDRELNSKEVFSLQKWLEEQEDISDDYDVFDLKESISTILEDGLITKDELDMLQEEIDDILEFKEFNFASDEALVNQLIGILNGISADSKLTDGEIDGLCHWINTNQEVSKKWPAYVIINKLNEILEDGIVTLEEKEELLDLMKKIVGGEDSSEIIHRMATSFFDEPIDTFVHNEKCICFTGKFISGARKEVEAKAKALGASTHPNVSAKVNAVIIGSLASRDWRYSNHGRKIEKALKLQEEGHDIIITSEKVWAKFL